MPGGISLFELADDFGTDKPLNPDYIDDVEEVSELLKDDNAQVMGLENTSLYNDGWAGWLV